MKALLLIISSLVVAACAHQSGQSSGVSGSDGGKRSGLVGEWRYADSIQSCHYVFGKDGKFAGEVTFRGKRVSEFSGKWTVRDNHLLYDYTGDVLGTIAPGTKDQDKLLTVSGDSFVIEAADGSERRYRRIK